MLTCVQIDACMRCGAREQPLEQCLALIGLELTVIHRHPPESPLVSGWLCEAITLHFYVLLRTKLCSSPV